MLKKICISSENWKDLKRVTITKEESNKINKLNFVPIIVTISFAYADWQRISIQPNYIKNNKSEEMRIVTDRKATEKCRIFKQVITYHGWVGFEKTYIEKKVLDDEEWGKRR